MIDEKMKFSLQHPSSRLLDQSRESCMKGAIATPIALSVNDLKPHIDLKKDLPAPIGCERQSLNTKDCIGNFLNNIFSLEDLFKDHSAAVTHLSTHSKSEFQPKFDEANSTTKFPSFQNMHFDMEKRLFFEKIISATVQPSQTPNVSPSISLSKIPNAAACPAESFKSTSHQNKNDSEMFFLNKVNCIESILDASNSMEKSLILIYLLNKLQSDQFDFVASFMHQKMDKSTISNIGIETSEACFENTGINNFSNGKSTPRTMSNSFPNVYTSTQNNSFNYEDRHSSVFRRHSIPGSHAGNSRYCDNWERNSDHRNSECSSELLEDCKITSLHLNLLHGTFLSK